MLLCQIFKFFSNIIFDTAPLVIINNFNSLVVALIAPLMLLFGHIQGQQLTGYLLASYLFISSSYVSLLTPLLGPTGLHIILILLAFITFAKSSVRVQYFKDHLDLTSLVLNPVLRIETMLLVSCGDSNTDIPQCAKNVLCYMFDAALCFIKRFKRWQEKPVRRFSIYDSHICYFALYSLRWKICESNPKYSSLRWS